MKRMLNRLLIGLIVGCAATASLQAQVTTWLTQGTSTGYDQVYDVTVDDWGNTYMYGQVEGKGQTITFGSFSQVVTADVAGFIVKVDPNGVVKWAKLMESNWIWPWDIDYGGGAIWFTGQFAANLDLGPYTLTTTGGGEGFLARIDTSGVITFGFSIPMANQMKGLTVDNAGNPVFVGEHVQTGSTGPGCAPITGNGTFQKYSSFIGRYDMSSYPVYCDWLMQTRSIQLSTGTTQYFNRPMDVATDAAGNTYVVGEFVGGMDWAGAVYFNAEDSSDTYVAKFSPTGNYEWLTVSSGTGHTICQTIEVSPNGDVTIGGYTSSGTNFGALQIPGTANHKSFLVKFDGSTGTPIAARYIGTGINQIYDIDSDSQSNLYITGAFGSDSLDLGSGVLGLLPNNNQGGYVASFDSTLTADWVKVWGGCCSAEGWGLELDPTESRLVVGGYYFGNMNLDGQSLVSTGQNEAFIANISLSQPADSIWPGDANDDLIANNVDLLQVGLAFGGVGPARPNATTNWTAQVADLWGSSVAGIDVAHADTDGNGIVDAADTLAINLNYGLMHNKGNKVDAVGPLLAARFLSDSLLAGDTATIILELGTGMDPANGVYGLAFSMQFDSTLVDASSAKVTYSQSWLGSLGTNMIKLDKIFESDGQIDFALARTNQQATSGYGEICRMTIIMVDDLTAKDIIVEPFTVELTDVTVIDELGGELGATTASDTIIVYQDGTDAIDPTLSSMLSLFPIPADDRLSVRLEGARALSWQLMDLHGALIEENRETRSDFDIDISSLAAGTYFFLMNTDRGIAAKKILIK